MIEHNQYTGILAVRTEYPGEVLPWLLETNLLCLLSVKIAQLKGYYVGLNMPKLLKVTIIQIPKKLLINIIQIENSCYK